MCRLTKVQRSIHDHVTRLCLYSSRPSSGVHILRTDSLHNNLRMVVCNSALYINVKVIYCTILLVSQQRHLSLCSQYNSPTRNSIITKQSVHIYIPETTTFLSPPLEKEILSWLMQTLSWCSYPQLQKTVCVESTHQRTMFGSET